MLLPKPNLCAVAHVAPMLLPKPNLCAVVQIDPMLPIPPMIPILHLLTQILIRIRIRITITVLQLHPVGHVDDVDHSLLHLLKNNWTSLNSIHPKFIQEGILTGCLDRVS